jgi:hypothetical protein
MATQWGRKETIIWPPHVPLMSYCSIAGALLLTVFFAWEHYAFQLAPLQKAYLTDYVCADIGSAFHAHQSYRLLYLGGGNAKPRAAMPVDFAEGTMSLPNGKHMRFALSDLATSQGYRFPFRGPVEKLADGSMYRWLHDAIYDRKSPWQNFSVSFLEGGCCLILLLVWAVPRDFRRFKELKYGRVLRGPRMLDPNEFNKAQKGDGLGFKTTESDKMMRIPLQKEAQHLQLMGDTGVGKTQLIMQCLRQIRGRGDSAIVYDPACEYIQRFYDASRGDIVLNPLDARCPYWGPAQELESDDEAYAIATSLYAPKTDKVDEFFHETPAQIFAHLLKRGPTPHQLAKWMSNDVELMKMVDGTEMAFYIDRKAGPQRAGVLSSLGLVAKCFRMLPERDENRPVWNARTWSKKREGWIFITSRPPERDTLRPLHSLWIDLLVMRLLSAPQPGQKPVWFVIDELASLQRLPQLHTAITENRKSKNPLILGFQGKAQLEVIYGHLAEVMLSQPATKIFMKTAEPKAAEWISEAIGKVEIERLKETKFDGTRSGHNFTVERQIEPLVMGSEISGLDDRHAYLKLGNNVARFAFEYMDLPTPTSGFLPRKTGGGLGFNPDTLEPITPPPDPKSEAREESDDPESEGPHDKERAPIAWPTPAAVQQAEEQKAASEQAEVQQEEQEEEQALGPALIRET